jgi:hypothetical protein
MLLIVGLRFYLGIALIFDTLKELFKYYPAIQQYTSLFGIGLSIKV